MKRLIIFSIVLVSAVLLFNPRTSQFSSSNKTLTKPVVKVIKPKPIEKITKKDTNTIDESKFQKLYSIFKGVYLAVEDRFKFVVEKSDKIISKKAFIATVLIVAPLFSIYCKFFDPTLLSRIIQKFSAETTQGAAIITKDVITGIAIGAKEVVSKEVVKEVLKDIADNSLDISVGLAKNAFKSPKAWGVAALAGGAWFGLKSVGSVLSKVSEKLAKEVAGKVTLESLAATAVTIGGGVFAPKMLFLTVPAFLWHRYAHHDGQMIPSLEDLGLNYIFGK